MDPLFAKLRAEETRKNDLIRELEQLTAAGQITSVDEVRLKREMKARFADLRGASSTTISPRRGDCSEP